MFWAQLLGTIIAGLTNLLTANWLLGSQDGICKTNVDFKCPSAATFYSASVIWGVISPNRMFGSGSKYTVINYFFIIGLLLPIRFYYLKKFFPNSFWQYVHLPDLLSATAMMPPAQPFMYPNWIALGFVFQFWARRYHPDWHLRFTYVLSAALDSGTAFMVLLSFFIFGIRNKDMVKWWRTRDNLCSLDGQPYYAPPEVPDA